MKKIEILKINIILTILVLLAGYGILSLIGFLMNLNITVPVLIIGVCYLIYIGLTKEGRI